MTVTIKKSDYQKLIDHAKHELPNEACGLIGGVDDGQTRHIKKVYLLTNIDHSREHFTLDPKEQLAAVKDMRSLHLQPLGNWHSHPETPSRPSEEDIRLSYDSSASYLILSLEDLDAPVLHSFHVENGVVTKEELVVEGD